MAKPKKSKAPKSKGKSKKSPSCARAAAKVESARRLLEREEKRLAQLRQREQERIAKAAKRISDRQAREEQKLKARHERERKGLDVAKVCTPPKRRTRSKKAGSKKASKRTPAVEAAPPVVELARGAKIEAAEHGFDMDTALVVAADHLRTDPNAYAGKSPPARRVTRPPAERLRGAVVSTKPAARSPRVAGPSRGGGALPHLINVVPIDGHLRASCDGASLSAAAKLGRRFASGGACLVAERDALFLVTVGPRGEDPWFIARVDAQVAREGHFWLRKGDLTSLTDASPRIDLDGDGAVLRISSSGGGNATITVGLAGDLPPRTEDSSDDLTWNSSLLRSALQTVDPFYSRDPNRPNLTGVYVHGDDGRTVFDATDGHRAMRFAVALKPPQHRLVWPAEVVGFLGGLVGATVSDVRVQSTSFGARLAGATKQLAWTVVFRAPDVVFPPVDRVIPQRQDFSCSVDGVVAGQEIGRLAKAAKAAKEKQPRSLWELSRDSLVVTAGGQKITIPLTCLPPDRQGAGIGLNPVYVYDVLDLPAFRGKVTFSMNLPRKGERDTLDPLRLDASNERWHATAVVMPMRL